MFTCMCSVHYVDECVCVCVCVYVCEGCNLSPSGQSGMGLSLAVVVRLSQWYEACCFIEQTKLLRQGFCWRFELCQSQMELHNTVNPSGCRIFLKSMDSNENSLGGLIQ